MGYGRIDFAARDLQTLLSVGALGAQSDGQLLDAFTTRGDARAEAAFQTLVERHGGMVLRVCRGGLRDDEEARDAFQATFLLLARKAGSIRDRDAVGSWLFGVAARVAARARVDAARRRAFERFASVKDRDDADDPARVEPDLGPVVQEEVRRLPDKYRAVVVLCDLEGLTYEEAASRLRCPLGTLKTRLFRARARLRSRLTHRGLAPPSADRQTASTVPFALARAASRLALPHASASIAGMVPARVVALAEGVSRTMFLSKLKALAAIALLGCSSIAAGAGWMALPGHDEPRAVATVTKADIADDPNVTLSVLLDRTLDRAEREAAAIQDPADRTEAMVRLARARTRRGENKAALEMLSQALRIVDQHVGIHWRYQPHTIISIAEAQAEAGDREAAHRTFQHSIDVIRAITPDEPLNQINHWGNFVPDQIQTEGREASRETIEAARRYYESLRGKEYPDESIRQKLLGLKAQSGDFAGVLREVRESEGFREPGRIGEERRSDAMLTIARALRPDDKEFLEPILTETRRVILASSDADTRNDGLKRFTETLIKLGRLDEAEVIASTIDPAATVGEFVAMSAFNKGRAFEAIAEARLKLGDKPGALKAARTAIETVRDIEPENHRLTPMMFSAEILAGAGDLEGAFAVVDAISPMFRVSCLERIATRREKAGDPAQAHIARAWALSQAGDQLRRANDAKPVDRAAVIGSSQALAQVQLSDGDLKGALRTLDLFPAGERQENLREMVRLQAQRGHVRAAIELLARIDDPSLHRAALIDVATADPAPSSEKPAIKP